MKYRYYMELFYSLYIHVNLPQEGLKRITLIMTTLKKFYCNLKVNNLYNYTFTYTYQYIQHRVFNRDNLKPDIQKKEKQKKKQLIKKGGKQKPLSFEIGRISRVTAKEGRVRKKNI